jgi:pullulanase
MHRTRPRSLLVEPSPVTNISPPDCTGDTNVFVRGLAGDWSCGAANKMNYLGFGTYRLDKVVAPTDVFKIATANWSTVNCGGAADGDKAAVGTPYTLTCGDPSKNLGLATSVGGTYRFNCEADGRLLVKGP